METEHDFVSVEESVYLVSYYKKRQVDRQLDGGVHRLIGDKTFMLLDGSGNQIRNTHKMKIHDYNVKTL